VRRITMGQDSSTHNSKFHGTVPRGLGYVPRSTATNGRFGRLFRHLPPLLPDDHLLYSLAETMIEEPKEVDEKEAPSNNRAIEAGFTYFGQFVDHDLSFDPTSKLSRDNDPDALVDFRTPRFDLDSIYGRGPDDQPFLYEPDSLRFLIGHNAANEDDLPRNANGRA